MAHSKESEAPNRLNSMKDLKEAITWLTNTLGFTKKEASAVAKALDGPGGIPKSVSKMIKKGIAKKKSVSSTEEMGTPKTWGKAGEPVAKKDFVKPVKKLILDEGAASKKKPSAKVPKPKPRPTRLKYDSDTGEGGLSTRKAKDKKASGGKQDTGENKNKKSDIKTVDESNEMVVDGANQKVKPKKAKIKVEYGKIIDDVQEEANLNKGGSVKYKSKMKKGGLVTKRGPMHRSSKRKS